MRRRRPPAPADDVDRHRRGELAEQPCGLIRGLVVAAECVRQAGVRMAGRVRAREAGQFRRWGGASPRRPASSSRRPPAAQPTQPNARTPQPSARTACSRLRSTIVTEIHNGRCAATSRAAGDRGLRIERVEDRLDQQEVDAAFGQGLHLLGVGGVDLIERHRPVRGIFHPRGQRQRDVQRADRTGDKPAARRVRCLPRELRTPQVHAPHQWLQPVVGLADARGGERVGGGDVRTSPRYCRCTPSTTSGRVRLSRSGSPVTSRG